MKIKDYFYENFCILGYIQEDSGSTYTNNNI